MRVRNKICDIHDLQKCLSQTWVDFEQNVIEAATDQWRDSLISCICVLVADTLNIHCMLRNYCLFVLCASSEHFVKLSM